MATKKSLLQEAIADAKEIKQIAFENAKKAMTETFAPELKKMVNASLREELEEEYSEEKSSEEMKEGDGFDGKDKKEFSKGEKKDWSSQREEKEEEHSSEESTDEDFDLDELLRELESEDDGDKKFGKSEEDGKPMDEKRRGSSEDDEDMEENKKDDESDAPPGKHDDAEYQIYLKLRKKFEPDMKEDEGGSDEEDFEKDSSDAEPGEEDSEYEVDEDSVEAIIRELEKGSEEDKKFASSEDGKKGNPLDEKHGDPEKGKGGKPIKEKFGKSEEDGKPLDEKKKMSAEDKKSSEEMKSEYAQLMEQYNDINLLNAKLLYFNKLLNENELNRTQKLSLLKAFDKATNVKEVKLIHSTISESLKSNRTIATKNKKQIKESLGLSSKAAGNSTAKKTDKADILNENSMYNRFQILAGLKRID